MAKLTKILEAFANIAILIVALLLIASIFRNRKVMFSKPSNQQEALGKVLAAPPGISWGDRDHTLIIAIQDGCRYCESSLPFYRDLTALEKGGETLRHISIIMPDQASIEEAYLKQAGLDSVPHTAGVSLASVDVTGTPTLLLVDSKGKIQKEWIGQLSQTEEGQVRASLSAINR